MANVQLLILEEEKKLKWSETIEKDLVFFGCEHKTSRQVQHVTGKTNLIWPLCQEV